MRVLTIYPGMDKQYNDNAYALIQLRQMGVELAVVTSCQSGLKTEQLSMEYEDMEGVIIYRIYRDFVEQTTWPIKKYHLVKEIATRFKPDLIFCSQQLNMPLAKKLKEDLGLPIVLLVEFAWDPMLLLGRRLSYLGIQSFAPMIAKRYWRWLCSSSDAIIICNPSDRHHLTDLASWGTPVSFIGWCNQVPEGVGGHSHNRERFKGIYTGSLQKRSFKNSEELLTTIPLILERTPTTEFVIVGNGELATDVDRMERQWRGRLHYIKELPRKEIWELIACCYYAYTPVKQGGWGFIGDAWSARTPLVVTHNGYEFTDGKDAIVSDPIKLTLAITDLCHSDQLYRLLQDGGESRYTQFHTAKRVAQDYYKVFSNCLGLS
jgi:glycosyltransferase involved in cell wall biosynthesis